jgi:hypothetical protein
MRGRLSHLLLSSALLAAFIAGPIAVAGPAQAAACSSGGSGGTVITPPTISGGAISFNMAVHVLTATYCPGQGASNDSTWTPPACWWQPVFTPDQLKTFAYSYYSDASSADLTWAKMTEYYETDGGKGETRPPGYKTTDGPPYSNWNIGADPGGAWWSIVFNQNMVGTPQFSDCLMHTMNSDGEPWSWVPNGDPAPANVTGPIITQEELAEYAASIMQLPASDFTSSPAAGQTVNLPMWVWAGNPGGGPGPYAPQILTACTGPLEPIVCATVTAKAVSFTIDPGTPRAADARVFDPCKINANGTVGTPYTGQAGNPPCGVTYLHSTTQGVYTPSVTVKWSVGWNGGGGGVWPKTDVMPGNTHQVTVQEIQTVVGH